MTQKKKMSFRLQRVREDGTQEAPQLFKIHELRSDWKMDRRGFLVTSTVGLGLFSAAAGRILGGREARATGASQTSGPSPSSSAEDCGGGIRAHDGDITELVCGADGKFMATASNKPDLKIWETPLCKLRLTTPAHPHARIAFSPNGRLLSFNCKSAKEENSVRVLDLATFRPVITLPSLTGDIQGLLFSPDGKFLVTRIHHGGPLSMDVLTIWEIPSGKPLGTAPGQIPLSFYPGGQLLASRSWEEENLQLLRLPSGRLFKKFDEEDMGVFGPSGKTLISLSKDNAPDPSAPDAAKKIRITIWDLKTWKPLKKNTITIPPVVRLAVSRDEKYLVAESNGNILTLLRFPDLEPPASGAGSSPSASNPAFSPTGSILAFVSGEGHRAVRCVDPSSGETVLSISKKTTESAGPPNDPRFAFSPEGRVLAVGFAGGSIELWDIPSRRQVNCLFDAAALQNGLAAMQYKATNEAGQQILHASPCGDSLPQGAVCTCDCVSASNAPANYCRCDLICTCVPV